MPSSRGASRPVALSLLRGQVGSSSLTAPGGPISVCVHLCACFSLALLLFLLSASLYDVHVNTYMQICVHFSPVGSAAQDHPDRHRHRLPLVSGDAQYRELFMP